jgi:hypothetical protein
MITLQNIGLVDTYGINPRSIGWRHHCPDIAEEIEEVQPNDKWFLMHDDCLV